MFHNHFVSWWSAVFASSAKGKIYELKSERILNFVSNVALHCSMLYVELNCIVIHCRLQRDALLWVWYVLHCMIIVITGRYTHKLGLQNSNLPKCTDQELDENVDTIADMLKGTYNYKTHMIGMYNNLYCYININIIYIKVTNDSNNNLYITLAQAQNKYWSSFWRNTWMLKILNILQYSTTILL